LAQALPSCSDTSRSCGCRSEVAWGRALAAFALLPQRGLRPVDPQRRSARLRGLCSSGVSHEHRVCACVPQ